MTGLLSRRGFLQTCAAVTLATRAQGAVRTEQDVPRQRRPVIAITDLYHPHQDRGDNFDLITAYALPEIDLRAVVFDVTERYRRPYQKEGDPYIDPTGPREPGFVPVHQLNYIFNRTVPCAAAPFDSMKSPDDPMREAPAFQSAGIDLIIQTLQNSPEPVDIVSFGSARPLAVAYNRAPQLLDEKVRMAHLCAGAAPMGYLEWNVQLDPHAFVCVLRANMNVAVYPCATAVSPFELGPWNCYYDLPDLDFVTAMAPPLQRYIEYAFGRSARHDFLGVLEQDTPLADMREHYHRTHNVWETAVWEQVAGRAISMESGGYRLLPESSPAADADRVISELLPCALEVHEDGQFQFALTAESTRRFIYHREDPRMYQDAMRQALPALYTSYLV